MDRSRHSRCFRMSCTSRHRSRQTPQHKSRLPSRSMCTSMCSSVSSTLVTVWAFRRNCFLIKVSMSTSFGPFGVLGQETTKVNRCGVLLKPRQSTTSSIQRASTAITLLGQEPPVLHRDLQHRRAGVHPTPVQHAEKEGVLLLVAGVHPAEALDDERLRQCAEREPAEGRLLLLHQLERPNHCELGADPHYGRVLHSEPQQPQLDEYEPVPFGF